MLRIHLATNEDATKKGQWWNINYCHFLLQKMSALWRIIGEEGYTDRLNEVEVYYVGRFPYVIQALLARLIPGPPPFHGREDRHAVDGHTCITIPAESGEPMNNPFLPSLAERMASWVSSGPAEFITVLVRGGKRKVPNLATDIVPFLADTGLPVRVVNFHGKPMAVQMETMMASKLVIACHGAELANAIFMRPGSALLEIMPYGFDAPYYGDLCRLVGAKHGQLWGTNPPDGVEEACEALREQTLAMSNKRFTLREVSWINVDPDAIVNAAKALMGAEAPKLDYIAPEAPAPAKIIAPDPDEESVLMKPWMSAEEIALIESLLNPGMRVLEWGSGGSTIHFSPKVSTWDSVEHNREWADKVNLEVGERALRNVQITFAPPSKPTPPHYNGPYYHGYEEAFAPYVAAGMQIADRKKMDAVFIDGRSRLACARGIRQALQSHALVFFHDFFNRARARYKPTMSHYRLVDFVTTGQTLAVFKPR